MKESPLNRPERIKPAYSWRNDPHKTTAGSFNGAIFAQHYVLRAVPLNQCFSSRNYQVSRCLTLVCQWVHTEHETVNDMTRLSLSCLPGELRPITYYMLHSQAWVCVCDWVRYTTRKSYLAISSRSARLHTERARNQSTKAGVTSKQRDRQT